LTSYAHQGIIEQAKLARPVGYLLKPFDGKDLYSSIEIGLYNFSQRGGLQQLSLSRINAQLQSPLTDKEFEILKSLHQGCTNKQMAEQHFISINTVKTHLKSVYEKFEA
ncbi:LuxR C-terminal-related transcriptional regulator, partial [Arthrospira platensis SPKY1]|nr:LuxR C-terminal-related transcriptional regulator [Arthrospira platensis SPKY1]